MNRLRIIAWFVLLIVAGAVLGWSYGVRGKAEAQFTDEVSLAREEAARIQRDVVMYTDEIAPARVSFTQALEQLGLDAATAARIATAGQRNILPFYFSRNYALVGPALGKGAIQFAKFFLMLGIVGPSVDWLRPMRFGFSGDAGCGPPTAADPR